MHNHRQIITSAEPPPFTCAHPVHGIVAGPIGTARAVRAFHAILIAMPLTDPRRVGLATRKRQGRNPGTIAAVTIGRGTNTAGDKRATL